MFKHMGCVEKALSALFVSLKANALTSYMLILLPAIYLNCLKDEIEYTVRSTVTGQDCEKYANCKSCTSLYNVTDM